MVARRGLSPRSVLVVLVLVSLTILTLTRGSGTSMGSVKRVVSDLLSPVQSAVLSVTRPVSSFFSGAAHYRSLEAENARLRNQVASLEAAGAGSAQNGQQLAALAALDHLAFAPNVPAVVADVVVSTSSNFQLSVELDKGSRDGVRAGMPVVAGSGLVGTVEQVAAGTCTVLLINDPTLAVGVRIGPQGALGVASGTGSVGALSVSFVAPGASVRDGELAETVAVQGGTYPAGIPVGTVTSVASPPGALQQRVVLAPLVDTAALQFVSILRWTAP